VSCVGHDTRIYKRYIRDKEKKKLYTREKERERTEEIDSRERAERILYFASCALFISSRVSGPDDNNGRVDGNVSSVSH
jgi:hypothetical protein